MTSICNRPNGFKSINNANTQIYTYINLKCKISLRIPKWQLYGLFMQLRLKFHFAYKAIYKNRKYWGKPITDWQSASNILVQGCWTFNEYDVKCIFLKNTNFKVFLLAAHRCFETKFLRIINSRRLPYFKINFNFHEHLKFR